jgi:hypothetical protein
MSKEEKIRKVEEILWQNEEHLSDGFRFYGGGYDHESAKRTVRKIAESIVAQIG